MVPTQFSAPPLYMPALLLSKLRGSAIKMAVVICLDITANQIPVARIDNLRRKYMVQVHTKGG
jgi:hypothetical protein